jgi:hypothetical protein
MLKPRPKQKPTDVRPTGATTANVTPAPENCKQVGPTTSATTTNGTVNGAGTLQKKLVHVENSQARKRLLALGHFFDSFRQKGDDYEALCPCHDDQKPSLKFKIGTDGRILIHCHAGCSTQTIVDLAGLRLAHLFPDGPWPRQIVETYDYTDRDGKLLYQSVHYFPKDFKVRRPDPANPDKWIWHGVFDGIEKVPYNLPQVVKARKTIHCEGEKDARRVEKELRDAGIPADEYAVTTNVGGAGKWYPEYDVHFEAKDEIIVLPHNDAKGRDHAALLTAHLGEQAGLFKIVELPGLADKGDPSDWFDAGGRVKGEGGLLDIIQRTPATPKALVIGVKGIVLGARDLDVSPCPVKENRVSGVLGVKFREEPPLGEAALYGMAGDFIRAVLPLTEATAPAILAHFLAAVGTLIGPRVYVWAGGKQYARVNHVLVGPTTRGRKGTAYFLVDRLLELACKDFWRRQCVDGLSSGEGLIEYLADKQEWNEDGKSYDTIRVEKRLCVVEQEFSRTLCVMEREGNTLSQILRSASDNGNLNSLTVKTRQAEGTHVTVVGHITPRELKDRLQDIQMVNGFGNRFLWWAVLSDKVLPHTEPIPADVFAPFVPALGRLKEMGGSATEVAVRLDSTAQERWETIYRSLREDLPGRVGAMQARGYVMVLRLALIYAILDAVASSPAAPSTGGNRDRGRVPRVQRRTSQYETHKAGYEALPGLAIGVVHLEAALAVWDYCATSAQLLFRDPCKHPLGNKLIKLLQEHGPLTNSDFKSHLSVRERQEFPDAILVVEDEGWVRQTKVEHGVRGGRPATRWELVADPGLDHDEESEGSESESEGESEGGTD